MDKPICSFIYQDAEGFISNRTIRSRTETKEYIRGYCESAEAIRTFRKDRIIEYLTDPRLAESRIQYYRENPPPPRPTKRKIKIPTDDFEICFTGFDTAEKESLIVLAKKSGLIVRQSVTVNLDFLCYGGEPGPVKLQKAKDQGVMILSERQFRIALETGKIPKFT